MSHIIRNFEFISFIFEDPFEVASQAHTMGAPETLPTRPMEAWLTFVGPRRGIGVGSWLFS